MGDGGQPRPALSRRGRGHRGEEGAAIELLGEVGEAARERLRGVMLRSLSSFATHEARFRRAGFSREDVRRRDPVELLRRLPVMDAVALDDLSNESLAACPRVMDIETSSGTTGPRKRRFITPDDERSETGFLARLFEVCGIGPPDSVACLDTGPLTLMVSFTKALDLLGAGESYAYCASPDPEATVEGLARLDPTAVISVPSILDRCLPALARRFGRGGGRRLRRVVYVGERLSEGTRAELEEGLGVEVYAYYGASETSALGVECGAHGGVHLFTDRNVIELRPSGAGSGEGDILVTTLDQEGLPLLRYALGDVVSVRGGPCPCGLAFPRVDVLGRTDGAASILGVNVSYESLLASAYPGPDGPGPMGVVLTNDGTERLTMVLPSGRSSDGTSIRNAVLKREPDLTYLVGARFLELELDFVDEAGLPDTRKAGKIDDRRGAPGAVGTE